MRTDWNRMVSDTALVTERNTRKKVFIFEKIQEKIFVIQQIFIIGQQKKLS